MLNNKAILITGGTGSFGKKFIETIFDQFNPEKIIVYSRDEQKQFQMSQKFSTEKYNCIRYFINYIKKYAVAIWNIIIS